MTQFCCTHCGSRLSLIDAWPRQCDDCGRFNYNSPKPVIALVLNAWGQRGLKTHEHPGVIVIKRGIEPYKGGWAFPGGYIDYTEDWRQAAVRECREELGIALDHQHLFIREVVTTPTNFLVMFVGYHGDLFTTRDWENHDLLSCVNDTGEQEILAIDVRNKTTKPLGVPSHNAYWQKLRLRQ